MCRWSVLFLAALGATPARAQAPRPLVVDDLFELASVAAPALSADGTRAAFTVQRLDRERDTRDTQIHVVDLPGGEPRPFTRGPASASAPRFSPDGRWLAFLSSLEGEDSRVWLADLRGGDPRPLSPERREVSELAWSPDGRRLALVVSDPDPGAPAPNAEGAAKTPRPIVVRRLQFKRDGEGYLSERRKHLYLIDAGSGQLSPLTSGPFDDSQPVWSPDGRHVAFVSKRSDAPDAGDDTDIFLVEASPGAEPRRVVEAPGADHSPAFSPDGRQLAFVAGGDPALIWYATPHIDVVALEGGRPRRLTRELDRHVGEPRFSRDGRFVTFLVEDAGNQHLARIPVGGGAIERLLGGERDVSEYDSAAGVTLVLESAPQQPAEVSQLLDGGRLVRVSRVNDAFLAGIRLGRVERFTATSPDGTRVDAFLTRPPDAPEGAPLPTLLRIHGGPVGQYSTGFELEWQMLAAHGYAVVGANPRGSSGYGEAFSKAIWSDWGNRDYQDVMAALDHAIQIGVADPERLGVGGWSYGGILTNYVITRTDRFKAAISGASEVNFLADYGTDHYQHEWEKELGLPWENTAHWVELSPFFRVAQIVTPTLILCGEKDMNVPLLNSEQLYQALKRLGRETELVIYPGQNHGIAVPSYQKDRFERYLAWYDRFLKQETAPTDAPEPEATSLLGEPLYARPRSPEDRAQLETDLDRARADYARDPDDPDHIIWLGRRLGYLERYREAIEVFSRGIRLHPDEPRFYRHRGHRYITTRRFAEAETDLERAAALIRDRPPQLEPDGIPSARGVPTTTTQFNIHYHLGLARYLQGELEQAVAAYRDCLEWSRESDENLVATSDWLYMSLRRLGRTAEAVAVLEPIRAELDVIDSRSYLDRLLLYKGEKSEAELLGPADELSLATQGYGVANWHSDQGRSERARELLERVVRGGYWAAFGAIAAEADLARLRRDE